MPWFSDLASGLGIPAAAVTLAVAIYVGCAVAEKAARPEALKDIGRVLKNASWSKSVRPSAVIERVFIWTFGERHLSWKCIKRSGAASVLFMLTLGMLGVTRSYVHSGQLDILVPTLAEHEPFFLNFVMAIMGGLIPDYFALAKSRVLIRLIGLAYGGSTIVLSIVLDILLSCLISLFVTGFVFLWYTIGIDFLINTFSKGPITVAERLVRHTAGFVVDYLTGVSPLPIFGVLFFSTLFTSVWTVLILLSTTVIKLLAPLQRFTSWFFDVDKHPVKAIGIVSAALVMIGSLVWTVLRAII